MTNKKKKIAETPAAKTCTVLFLIIFFALKRIFASVAVKDWPNSALNSLFVCWRRWILLPSSAISILWLSSFASQAVRARVASVCKEAILAINSSFPE